MSNSASVLQPPNNFAPVHILVNDIGIHIISYDTKVSSQELLEGVYYCDMLKRFDAGKNNKFIERFPKTVHVLSVHRSVDVVYCKLLQRSLFAKMRSNVQ